jgi:hypothetical protein
MAKRKNPQAKAVAEAELAYGLRRWRAGMRRMNEITAQEARDLTDKERSHLIEMLFESGRDLKWPDRTGESAAVAGRWNRLREVLGARS